MAKTARAALIHGDDRHFAENTCCLNSRFTIIVYLVYNIVIVTQYLRICDIYIYDMYIYIYISYVWLIIYMYIHKAPCI